MRDWLGSNAVPSNLKDGKVKLQGGGCGDRHGWNQKWHVQCPTKDINSSCLLFVCYLFWVDDLRLAKFSHVIMAEAPWKKTVILSRKDKLEDGRKLIENDMCLVFFLAEAETNKHIRKINTVEELAPIRSVVILGCDFQPLCILAVMSLGLCRSSIYVDAIHLWCGN